ncbi:hypothetical protein [Paenibacillus polymyxa]|uniref:hypothetical protein n=1 Tax=Paenibacillus polymyxa TaxID=1406 RepID=UPI0011198968|nr:hypothetical protein [Paenibacillus polymyxa]QDA30233.1 hypothetical protein FGY93_25270 [Paenibacillus polymyxa]
MKPGYQVIMQNCYEARKEKNKDKVWTVNSEPWELCGSEVVLLDGYNGGFATKFLRVVSTASVDFKRGDPVRLDNGDLGVVERASKKHLWADINLGQRTKRISWDSLTLDTNLQSAGNPVLAATS